MIRFTITCCRTYIKIEMVLIICYYAWKLIVFGVFHVTAVLLSNCLEKKNILLINYNIVWLDFFNFLYLYDVYSLFSVVGKNPYP